MDFMIYSSAPIKQSTLTLNAFGEEQIMAF